MQPWQEMKKDEGDGSMQHGQGPVFSLYLKELGRKGAEEILELEMKRAYQFFIFIHER